MSLTANIIYGITSFVIVGGATVTAFEIDLPADQLPPELKPFAKKVKRSYSEAEKARKAAMFYTQFDYNSIPKVSYTAERQMVAEEQFKAQSLLLDQYLVEFKSIKGFDKVSILKAEVLLVNVSNMLFSTEALPVDMIERLFKAQDEILSYLDKAKSKTYTSDAIVIEGSLKFFANKVVIDDTKLKKDFEELSKTAGFQFKTYQEYRDFMVFSGALQLAVKNVQSNFASEKLNVKVASTDEIQKFAQDLISKRVGNPSLVKFVTEQIKDRYMNYAKEVIDFNETIFTKWQKIYKDGVPPVEKVNYEIPKNGRFMFEIRTPHSESEFDNIRKELDLFKKEGYIGVVFVWDGKEDYQNLIKAQEIAKEKGFRIWLSFSTHDYLSHSSYIDPDLYQNGLSELSKNSEAFLMGWRRTSIHLQIQDEPWQNFTMQACRKGNPNIGFIGEYYYGYNGTHPAGEFHGYLNLKNSYNGIIVVNFGFLSVNPRDALRMIHRTVPKDVPLVIVIWGESVHYLNSKKSDLRKRTKPQYRRINRLLEKRFMSLGFHASIGCAGDGSNQLYGKDDMCFSDNHSNTKNKY